MFIALIILSTGTQEPPIPTTVLLTIKGYRIVQTISCLSKFRIKIVSKDSKDSLVLSTL